MQYLICCICYRNFFHKIFNIFSPIITDRKNSVCFLILLLIFTDFLLIEVKFGRKTPLFRYELQKIGFVAE